MKRILASAGLIALGTAGTHAADVATYAPTDKPWSVSLTLRGFYDDNTTLASKSSDRQHSFGIEVSPTVAVGLSTEQTSLGARYAYSMKYYFDRPGDEPIDHTHEFQAWLLHNFSERYSVDINDSFIMTQEPTLGDPSLGTVQRSQQDNIRNEGTINFHIQATRLVEFVLGYRNVLYDYCEEGFSVLLDRMEHYGNLDLRWQVHPETFLVLGYQYGLVDYTGSRESEIRNSESHYVYAGADHYFLRNLYGSVRVGAQFVDYCNAESHAVNPYARLSLRYNYLANSYVETGFEHGRAQTDALALDQEYSLFYGTLSHHITPKLVGTLTGQARFAEFNSGLVDGECEDVYLVGLNLEYQFTRNFSGHVGYNYDIVCSDVSFRGYDRNRAYVGVTASY